MTILSVLPVALLAVFIVWFFWPLVADPITRLRSGRPESEADAEAEHMFALWSKYGQATPLLVHADRS